MAETPANDDQIRELGANGATPIGTTSTRPSRGRRAGTALLVVLFGVYFLILASTLLDGLVNVWPAQAAPLQNPGDPREVPLFFGVVRIQLTAETRLILLVAFMGALGSYIHTATSFTDHVGQGDLTWSWVWFYLLRPFIGLSLALIFYFAIRGGLLSGSTGPEQVSAFGVAAVSGIIGMFSKQAAEKLLQVFNTMFGTVPAPQSGAPVAATSGASVANGRVPAPAAGADSPAGTVGPTLH